MSRPQPCAKDAAHAPLNLMCAVHEGEWLLCPHACAKGECREGCDGKTDHELRSPGEMGGGQS